MNRINWRDQKDGESRLLELRDRDLEISSISLGLQMRTRISRLEHEVKLLRKMEDSWTLSKLSRVYFYTTRLFGWIGSQIEKRRR